MNNRNRFFVVFAMLWTMTNIASAQFSPNTSGGKKIGSVMYLIDKFYVDKSDDNKLAEEAIKTILEKLDPHSSYISATEVKEMNEPLEGNFDGIGVSFNMISDTLYIVETIAGGPSQKIGIYAGDRIIAVNDSTIAGVKMSTRDIMKKLRGPKGTNVNVKILRRGVTSPMDFKIVRDKIPIFSLDASYMIDKETGYIRLSRFGATTLKEFQTALQNMQQGGMKNLVLDLQYNGGGYLSAAIGIANECLVKDRLIVYTEGEHQSRYTEKSNSKGSFETGKLVVMVNEASASASEIVSGAIQDWDRGVIVGRRTFGKGLVQRPFPLSDGSEIRLTVARYYTPTGRCIQKPYNSGSKEEYAKDMIDRYNRGEMASVDSIHFPDSLKYTTLLNGRTVYGGGGIMPDIFVPLDTTKYSDYYIKINAKNLLNRAALLELDENRKMLAKKYPTFVKFKNEYRVPESLLTQLKDWATEEKIEYNEEQYTISKGEIINYIRSIIARDLYDQASSYQIINEHNDVYQKAVEVIRTDALYKNLLHRK